MTDGNPAEMLLGDSRPGIEVHAIARNKLKTPAAYEATEPDGNLRP